MGLLFFKAKNGFTKKYRMTNNKKATLAKVNQNAKGSPIADLIGKTLTIKKQGKKKTSCNLYGFYILINNEMLDVVD